MTEMFIVPNEKTLEQFKRDAVSANICSGGNGGGNCGSGSCTCSNCNCGKCVSGDDTIELYKK
jgi:hypothetical protein